MHLFSKPSATAVSARCPSFSARRSLPSAPSELLRNKTVKKATPLQLKRAAQAEREERLRNAFATAKVAERATQYGRSKRKDTYFLARYLGVSTASEMAIRSCGDFQTRSYNLGRQALELADHLFVQYRVPHFLYRAVLSWEGLELIYEASTVEKHRYGALPEEWRYLPWFFAVAKGESFAKASKDVFTKKEAHYFLQAPGGNPIELNIFWAKAAAAGVPVDGCNYLVRRISLARWNALEDRLGDFLRFYSHAWPLMNGYLRDDLTDFITEMIPHAHFTFKGRTFGSMRKLCAAWHRRNYSVRVKDFRTWEQMFQDWEVRRGKSTIRAIELTNNRALADEGRKQRHCVFTYTWRCEAGSSRIVSLRWYPVVSQELVCKRITLEISPSLRRVVQIRGLNNRRADDEELKIVRLWAGEFGLSL